MFLSTPNNLIYKNNIYYQKIKNALKHLFEDIIRMTLKWKTLHFMTPIKHKLFY